MLKLKLSVPKKKVSVSHEAPLKQPCAAGYSGVIRRYYYSYPGRIRNRLRIPVGVSGANRSYWSPEVVKELRVPAGDQSVATGGCE